MAGVARIEPPFLEIGDLGSIPLWSVGRSLWSFKTGLWLSDW